MKECEQRFRLLGRQGLLAMALAGVEMALWDALARAVDAPVARLLGAEPKPIRAYDSFGVLDIAADRTALEDSVAAGFKAIKLKIGDGDAARDVATLKETRAIVGADIALMVDYNQTLTVPDALRRIERLAPFDLTWVEEPVPAEDLVGHAAVRARSAIHIQTGENWWFPADAAKAIAAGASDFAMLDVMKIGGVGGWMQAAALAEAASLPVSSHAFVEVSAHLLAATRGADYLEYLNKAAIILKEPLTPIDGAITARGPGFGMDWDEEKVARYLV